MCMFLCIYVGRQTQERHVYVCTYSYMHGFMYVGRHAWVCICYFWSFVIRRTLEFQHFQVSRILYFSNKQNSGYAKILAFLEIWNFRISRRSNFAEIPWSINSRNTESQNSGVPDFPGTSIFGHSRIQDFCYFWNSVIFLEIWYLCYGNTLL